MNEIFKDIPGYEGEYQVSNFGNVISLKFNKKRVLKAGKSSEHLQVVLCKNGIVTSRPQVHILVWEVFNGKIPPGYVVHHVDYNPENNKLNNLKLMTRKEHSKLHNPQNDNNKSKPVLCFDLDGNFIKEFPSERESVRWLRESIKDKKVAITPIICCCKGIQYHKTAYGYIWKYKNPF